MAFSLALFDWRLPPLGVAALLFLSCCSPSKTTAPADHSGVIAPPPLGAPSAGASAPESGEWSATESTPPAAPEPAPTATQAPLPPRPLIAQADLDPNNDGEVAPPEAFEKCEASLQKRGISFKPADIPLRQKVGDTFTCGAEQVVLYEKGPAGLKYNARPRLTCRMALALSRFEELANELAEQHLGSGIRKITHIGTYSCRKMTRFSMVSEHSYANAIDIKSFQLENWRTVSVLKHFGKLTEPPQTKESRFLRELAHRLYNENVFSVVLTPYFDALHRDHFHLDLARYRLDGTRASN